MGEIILFPVLKINFELLVINETQFVKEDSCFENQFELLDKLEEHFVKDVFLIRALQLFKYQQK